MIKKIPNSSEDNHADKDIPINTMNVFIAL